MQIINFFKVQSIARFLWDNQFTKEKNPLKLSTYAKEQLVNLSNFSKLSRLKLEYPN